MKMSTTLAKKGSAEANQKEQDTRQETETVSDHIAKKKRNQQNDDFHDAVENLCFNNWNFAAVMYHVFGTEFRF
jgi:hypothetical protein